MNYATDRGYNEKQEYRKFKCYDEDSEVVFLSRNEVMKLKDLDLKKERLSRVRDDLPSCSEIISEPFAERVFIPESSGRNSTIPSSFNSIHESSALHIFI